jgi:hypothetical protein
MAGAAVEEAWRSCLAVAPEAGGWRPGRRRGRRGTAMAEERTGGLAGGSALGGGEGGKARRQDVDFFDPKPGDDRGLGEVAAGDGIPRGPVVLRVRREKSELRWGRVGRGRARRRQSDVPAGEQVGQHREVGMGGWVSCEGCGLWGRCSFVFFHVFYETRARAPIGPVVLRIIF